MNYLLISRHFHYATSGIQTYLDALDNSLNNDSLIIITNRTNKTSKTPSHDHKIIYCSNLYAKSSKMLRKDLFRLLLHGHVNFFLLLFLNRSVRNRVCERYKETADLIKKTEFNGCISANVCPEGVIPILLKKHYGIKSIILLHGSEIHSFSGSLRLKLLMRYILRNADLVVANSHYMEKEVQNFCNRKLRNVFVNHLGFNNKVFVQQRVPKSKASNEPTIILSVSNFVYGKGIDILLKALNIVKTKQQNFKYIMLGNRLNGEYQDHLDKLISDFELEENVISQKAVKYEELPKFYRSSDFLILPSRKEAFGLVILEANSCGKPVIAADTGGIPELITDGENGLLFNTEDHEDLAEKILLLIEDPEYCRNLGVNAWQKVHGGDYSWESSMKRLAQRIKNLSYEQ